MIELAALCQQLGIDESAARRVLPDDDGRPLDGGVATRDSWHAPWYVQAILGIGAWITAIAIVAFVATLLYLLFDYQEPDWTTAAIGAGLFGFSLALERLGRANVFIAQFGVALASAGLIVAASSVGFRLEGIWPAALTAAVGAALVIVCTRSLLQQFLSASLAATLAIAALLDGDVGHPLDIVSLTGAAGVGLILYPPRRDVRPLALVLLLALPLTAVAGQQPFTPEQAGDGWIARAVGVGILLVLLWLRQGAAMAQPRRPALLLAATATAIAVGMLLPPGGSAALTILALGFALGSRPMALAGIFLQAFFIWEFYYDLSMTLMQKSLLLAVIGALLLVAYALLTGVRIGAVLGPPARSPQ